MFRFGRKPGIVPCPVDEHTLMCYVAFRYLNSTAIGNTISGEVSAIISWHTDQRIFIDRTTMKTLKRVIDGVRKDPTRKSYTSKPITNALLARFLSRLNGRYFDQQVMRAALLLAHRALLRCSEYAVLSQKACERIGSVSDARTLRLRNLKFIPSFRTPRIVTIQLLVSKTNQTQKFEQCAIKCECPKALCAVCELMKMLRMRKLKSLAEPLFRLADGRVLSRHLVENLIHNLATDLKLDTRYYAPHSLRKGGATELKKRGVDDSILRGIGRWKSDSMFLYILLNAAELAEAAY